MSKPNKDQILGHADESDGIEEYDNLMPMWWLGILWFCFAWGIIYAINYHFVSNDSQEARYEAEVAAAEAQWPTPAPKAPEVTGSEGGEAVAAVGEGKAIYDLNCVACHGAALEGGIGPSLVDDEWIHGASEEEVIKSITDGVPAKAMPAWGAVLGAEKVAAVAAYVLAQGS